MLDSTAVTDPSRIRNFSIVAHIDHGKSTLADRILELTHTIEDRDMMDQVLDSMDLERERGITIKAQAVRVLYTADDGVTYTLDLIDTPGHVDFTYEVSRSLAACEGVLLIVDAAQGVEAQTVANALLAMNANLTIIPVINKIDLPAADPERAKHEIEEALAIPAEDAVLTSAKTGVGIRDVLEAIVHRVPAPVGEPDEPLAALIFDSYFDPYRGVVALIRVVNGRIRKGDKVLLMATRITTEVEEVGVRRPQEVAVDSLGVGEVGYLITGLKDPSDVKVGDTVTWAKHGATEMLPGYRDVKPMVYTGLFPIDGDQYPDLRDALDKLKLNDPALIYEPESSHALGFGFRCGFLGLLHLEIIKERLEREFDLDLLATAPSVEYRITKTNGEVVPVHSPQDMPDPGSIQLIEEPYLKVTVLVPPDYVGAVMELATGRRATFADMQYLSATTVEMHYEMPLSEIDHGLLRPAEVADQGLRLAGLRTHRLPREPAREARHPARGQARGRAFVHRPQGQGPDTRPRAHREAARDHPSADVRGAHPGGHRWAHHQPRDGARQAQGRARQVLRRRHQPQAQAAREAEEGQEADEVGGQRGGPAGGVHGDPQGGRVGT